MNMKNNGKPMSRKFYTKPDIEFTKEFMSEMLLMNLQDRIKKIASEFRVSIQEAAEIHVLFIFPAVHV